MDFENKINYKEITDTPEYNVVSRIVQGKEVLVRTWLPMHETLQLISRIVNHSIDESDYCNPCRVEIVRAVEVVLTCTNVEIPEEDLEDMCLVYDQLRGELLYKVIDALSDSGYWPMLANATNAVIDSVYKYTNSARGLVKGITTDLENVQFDVDKLQEKMGNPENLGLLRDVLSKLG